MRFDITPAEEARAITASKVADEMVGLTLPQRKVLIRLVIDALEEERPQGVKEFFVHIEYPHKWTAGHEVTGDPTGDMSQWPFKSLEAARAYAEKEYIPGHNENSTKVTYGVRYVHTVGEEES